MQQRNGYTAANAAMNGNNRDWAGEITPPARSHNMPDAGMGGAAESGMSGMETRNGERNRMRDGMGSMQNGMNGMWNEDMSGMQSGMSGMGQPSRPGGTLDMRNDLPDDVIESPTTNAEVYAGSTKAMLRRNLGNYVVATFLVGTQNTVSWEGILYDVGNDYVTIYQPGRDRYIVNDIYSLRYTEFYDVRRRQLCDRLMREQGWDVEENRSSLG